jgi:hypothetical protein
VLIIESRLRKQSQFRPVRMGLEPPFHVTECPERATQLTVGVAPFTPALKADHPLKTDLFQLSEQCEIVQLAFIQWLDRRNVTKTVRIPTTTGQVRLLQVRRYCFQRSR